MPLTTAQLARLGLVVTALLWGGNHVVIRAVSGETSVVALVFWRWALVIITLLPFTATAIFRNWNEIRKNLTSIALLGFINCVVFSFAIIAAPFGTAALNVGLLQATAPVWVLFLSAISGDQRMTEIRTLVVLIGFVGTALLLTDGTLQNASLSQFRWGDGVAVLAAVIWAAYSLLLRRQKSKLSPMVLFSAMTIAGFTGLMFSLFLLASLGMVSLADIAVPATALPSVLYVGIGATLFGNLFWNIGVQKLGASAAAQYLFLAPIASSALAVVWLGETLSIIQVIGALLVGTSLLIGSKIRS